MRRSRSAGARRLAAPLLLALAAAAPTAGAQIYPWPGPRYPRPVPRRPPRGAAPVPDQPPPPRVLVGVSPVLLLLGSWAGDVEVRGARTSSWGLGLQYDGTGSILNDPGSGSDLDASLKWRYYLAGRALDGPSIGVVGGFTRYSRDRRDDADPTLPATRSRTVPTLGLTVDQNWLVGRDQRVVLGLGAGVKRRYDRDASDLYDPFRRMRYTVRFLVGYAWR